MLAETGEDRIVACDSCGYAANVEQAELRVPTEPAVIGEANEISKVPTPGKKTIEDSVIRIEFGVYVRDPPIVLCCMAPLYDGFESTPPPRGRDR